ncbi:S8/S53 family peptidase [Flavobacterium sp. NRK1]|uniref:S8/S53 family peptidase n=1 Tax=Flavobacterium sp. NRK1 TaxID=2954929 RepID=UPI00209269B7|nr:S8/S53 family peptidase [Flavobacterium sp. NRK1]MCO6148314.1 S8 family peptidase [Flavobacterium sp. NRK1]
MKKNTVKLFILALMLGGGFSAFSQTRFAKAEVKDADAKRLIEHANEFKRRIEDDYAKAVKFAEANNLPLIIKGENGRISKLIRIDENNTPIYIGTNNVGSAITSRTNHLQPGGSLGLNLTGEFGTDDKMIIGVWDGGYARPTHHDLVGRTINYDGGTQGVALHPTHVTGTIIGDGSSASAARGMASKAFAFNSDYDTDSFFMGIFASEGYVISNHSYGIDQTQLSDAEKTAYRGTYINLSRDVDQITFDAPYYQPVFAAGNDGNGFSYDRLTDRAVSKNGIAVAAIYEVDDYVDAGSVAVTVFSSFGPTNDNRIKPDISTKGINVYSCSDASDTAHQDEQGTSMAAPGITGTIALLQQYYATLHPSGSEVKNFMKSATVRALVAHSADEAGDNPGPDPIYGWGLMNAKRAAEIIKADNLNTNAEIQELVLTPGQTYTYTVNASGTEPLVATMAWTDPPGQAASNNSATPVLINDLDIKVKKGTEVNLPWRLDSGTGTYAEKGDNKVDNIEKVEVENASGQYTITVTHKKSTLQNPNGNPQQEYSLIISGITNGPLGLDDNNQKMFSVWPNPANDIINISFANGVEKDASATLYDIQGRLVSKTNLTNVDNVVGVQGLAKGLYVVSVVNGGKTEIEKVVIK